MLTYRDHTLDACYLEQCMEYGFTYFAKMSTKLALLQIPQFVQCDLIKRNYVIVTYIDVTC